MLGIAAVAVAIGYLLVIAAVAAGTLALLVWGFGEAPGRGSGPESGDVEGLLSADRSGTTSEPLAQAKPECSEDEAA